MKILIINHYAGSIDYGMEYRPFYFAREWVKMGHTVDIIAADYSHLRIKNPYVKKDFETECIDDITYHWVKTGKYKGNGVKRALTMFRFISKLYYHANEISKRLKPDVIITSSTYPLDTYPAKRIANFADSQLIHEVHDMWPLSLIEFGNMSKWHPFVLLIQLAENKSYKHSNKVVSLLPYAENYMVKHGLKPGKFYHVPNGIVISDWEKIFNIPQEHQHAIDEQKEKGRFICCFFGSHTKSYALDYFINSSEYLTGNNVCLLLVGDGTDKDYLQELAKQKYYDNVVFLPSVPKDRIPDLLKKIDCIYVGARNVKLLKYGVCMNKIYDAMMSGKPIIYAINSPNNDIEDAKCGITVESESSYAIANGIKKLMCLSEYERKDMGERGRKAVLEKYNYKVLSEKFINIIEN